MGGERSAWRTSETLNKLALTLPSPASGRGDKVVGMDGFAAYNARRFPHRYALQ